MSWWRSNLGRFSKLVQLPWTERFVLFQAASLFVVVDLALRIVPFQRLLRLHRRLSAGPVTAGPPLSRLIWLVQVAGRFTPVEATCLKRALVLSWFLGRRGVPTTLRIGVARRGGTLDAHAWLEYVGQEIEGPTATEEYLLLFSAP